MRIYLDTCCLNRPFDDQNQDRIRLESEAVRLILHHVESGEFTLIGSEILRYEIAQIPDEERRIAVSFLIQAVKDGVAVKKMTSLELRKAGYRAIFRELGAAGLIRFIQEHSIGSGDYTKERRQWLTQKSVKELAADIREWRKSGKQAKR